jgi:hypothetical protein
VNAVTLAGGAGEYAGPLGLLVVLLMGVALWLLIKNMSARIRRLPDSFESKDVDEPGGDDSAG